MKHILLFLFFSILSLSAIAQPANDDCAGIIDLGVAPLCPSPGIYTNVDATASDIGNDNIPLCFNGGNVDRDVWFQFTTDGTITDYNITVNGITDGMGSTPITNPQIEVYRGDLCGFDELASLAVCASANNGDNFVSATLLGLDPNTLYYIRINDYTATASPNSGSFQFCITEFIPDINICDGPGTTACSGTLYDCGGPDMDYGFNDNYVYTICPSEFHECILIDIIEFNIENNFDVLNIYAGDNINAPLLSTLTGAGSGTGFQIQTSSDCVTFQFLSDGSVVAPGFELDWLCVSFPCSGSSENTPEVITNLPFTDDESTCGEASTIGDSPCPDDAFLNGPDYFYTYDSPGDICVAIEITNAVPGTGVLVLDGPPSDPNTNCVAQGPGGVIGSANMETAGTYYIIVANGGGCTDFDINITVTDCNLSPALVDALCNPLNGCQEFDSGGSSVPSTFFLDVGFEDIPIVNGLNQGCYAGIGAGNFYWFTIQAQAPGPFGFIVDGANFASDIDLSVWGPFTEMEVCETPNDVIDYITNNQPIRSSWSGGADPTGLVDIHPVTGIMVTDEFDCGSPATPGAGGDDFVSTIATQTDEVYVVLINDWGGQIVDGVITVDWSPSDPAVLDPLPIEIIGNDTTICIGDTAMIGINAAVNDIEWLTNTGSLSCDDCPNPLASPTETTIYLVAVNGVCNSDTVEVKVAVFDVEAGPDFTVCLGEDVQFDAGSEFDNATYEWTGMNLGDLSCTDCPNPVLTTTMSGTFTYTVTLTGPGCILTDQVIVTVLTDPAPIFGVVADTVLLCSGEATDLGLGTNPGNYTYTWTSDPPGYSSNFPNPSVIPSQSTTYYVQVNTSFCPITSMDSVYVEVSQLPVLNVAPDTLVCQGESVILGTTVPQPGVSYEWSPDTGLDDATIANPTATIAGTTTYTLTATDGGCVETASITVTSTVIAVSIQNAADSLLICKGEEVNITATSAPFGTTVTWTPADGSINPTTGLNVTATPGIATTYYASVTVPGCTQMDSIYIDVDSIPTNMIIMPSDTSVCMGSLVVLQSPTYDPVDFPDIEHLWTPNNGFQSPEDLYNMVIEANITTIYIRTTTNGICVQMDTAIITIDPTSEILITPTDTTICQGESVQFLATSPDITDFEWTPGDGSLSCTDCPDPVATPTGSGTFTYTAEGEFEGCPVMASASIEVLTIPSLALTTTTIYCPGDDPITLNTANADPNSTYTWSSDPTDPALDINAAQPTVSPTETTTYSVEIVNGVCDTVFDQVTIIVPEIATVTVDPDIIVCEDEIPVTINASSTGNDDFFSWDTGETGSSIAVDESGIYTVTYDDGCNPPIVNTIMVTVNETANLSIVPSESDTMLVEGNIFDLTVIAEPPSQGALFEWNTGQNGETITTTILEINPAVYTVTMTDANGCIDSTSASYGVLPAMPDFPNAFTPNNDGTSDYFNFVSIGSREIVEFKIFNRWGEQVYNNETPETGWDGKKKEKDMPADVYLYFAIIKKASGEEETFKGDVTLIR
jgi:gliding motility-associated-like protein